MKTLKRIKKILLVPLIAIAVIGAFLGLVWIKLTKNVSSTINARKLAKKLDKEAQEAIENNEDAQKTITKQYNDYLSSFNKFKSKHKMH